MIGRTRLCAGNILMPEQDSSLPQSLVEGVDYYMEDGKFVFTASFHLRRGHCCESGCRHCPYGYSKAVDPKAQSNAKEVDR
jgi:hypothetical protein